MVILPSVLHHKPSLLFLILAPPTCGCPPSNAPSLILHVVSIFSNTYLYVVVCSTHVACMCVVRSSID